MHRFENPASLAEEVGAALGTSDWITVDQAQVDGFAEVTGDHQWIHVDPVRAKDGPFGTTIAHGYLTLALAPVVLGQVVEVDQVRAAVNYGLNKVRFPAPVPVGSRLRGHVSLVSATPRGESIEAVFSMTLEIEGASRPACVAEMVVLYT